MMMKTPLKDDPYSRIAELYDLEHEDFDADIDLLLNFAEVVGDPILEVGCGSGRIMIPLAEAGFDITGIDNSRPMLKRAEKAIADAGVEHRTKLVEGDMRELEKIPGEAFGIVIFSLNSLMHLTTAHDQRAALLSARKALDPKGQLILDLMNPSVEQLGHLMNGPHLEGSWSLPDGSSIDKWSHRKQSSTPQVMDTLLWYDRTRADESFTRTRTAFQLRYIHASELALMLELCGFIEPLFYGSYDLDPYDTDADRLFVTAEVSPAPRARD